MDGMVSMLDDAMSSMLHTGAEILPAMGTLGSRIKSAREAKGLTQTALAKYCGVSRNSVSQWEKDETEPTGINLVKIARALGVSEVWLAEGREYRQHGTAERGPKGLPPSGTEVRHLVPFAEGGGLEHVAIIPEIMVSAGMGDSGVPEIETFGSDTVRDNWGLPEDYVRGELRSAANRLRIIDLKGDSMAPTLFPTDRAIVDIGDKSPSPPGIFALWDGYGVIVKRVEIVPQSKPTKLRIISDNTLHQPYEIEPEEHTIIGRLRGFIRRL
jgi:phage repressor protein C with HTH and peptisase S24 domain